MYKYKAIVRRVIDGDTIEVDIDLGFKTILQKEKLRLLDIDTPELRSKSLTERIRAQEAKLYVQSLLPEGKEVLIETRKDEKGKYGRYLAYVFIENKSLCDLLKENGHEK